MVSDFSMELRNVNRPACDPYTKQTGNKTDIN